MICHHTKCIFVHIPKNAGQSIEHVFLNRLGLTWETRAPLLLRYNGRPELGPPRLAHLRAEEYVRYKYLPQEMYDEYFKFAFVRNPWSRMVSFYKISRYSHRLEFKQFLTGVFKNKFWYEKRWFMGPQTDFIYSGDDSLLVDFVGRFEQLQNDFNQVCDRIGLPHTEIPHVNLAENTKPNPSREPKKLAKYLLYLATKRKIPTFKRYQDYYDRESKELVAELYNRDIELLGYDFE